MQKGKKHKRRWHRWLGLPLGFILVVFALSGIVLNHRHFFSSWEVNRAILPSLFQYKDWNNGFIRGSLELPNPDIFGSDPLLVQPGKRDKRLEVLVYGNDGVWLTDRELTSASPLNDGFPKGVDNRGIRSVVIDSLGGLWAITQTDLWRYDYQGKEWRNQALPIPTERLSDLTIKGDTLLVVGRSHLFVLDLKEGQPDINAHLNIKTSANLSNAVNNTGGPDNATANSGLRVAIHTSDEEKDNGIGETETEELDKNDLDKGNETKNEPNIRLIEINPDAFSILTITPSEEYSGGGRQSLFRIMLKVHSGEIFGLKGKLFMDTIAVIFILMSLSGIVFYFVKKRKSCKGLTRILFRYHKRLGIVAFVLLLFVVFTGWTLRPPALIALVTSNVGLDGENVWEDKLRNLRYDDGLDKWLLSTSDGFYRLDDLEARPEKVDAAPAVSVMGVNVWEPHDKGWLLGSFSGMYIWDTTNGRVWDYFTGEEVETGQKQGPPFGKRAVGGHFLHRPVEFYNGIDLGQMPQELRHQPISLWNLALEVHTGRIYTFLGPGTTVFIFIFGSLIMWLLISGLKRVWRKKHLRTSKEKSQNPK